MSRTSHIFMALPSGEDTMYVCLCNSLTERDVQPHIASGGSSVAMVYSACGCRPQCGKCVPFMRQMLREGGERAAAAPDGAD